MQPAKIRDNIESVVADRRALEFRRLIETQRELIEESNERGYDATSARIVFESLLISFSLYVQYLRHHPI